MTSEKVLKFEGNKSGRKSTGRRVRKMAAANLADGEHLRCSFCGRGENEVIKMVKGTGVNICSECTMIAVQYLILKDRMVTEEAQQILDAFWGDKK